MNTIKTNYKSHYVQPNFVYFLERNQIAKIQNREESFATIWIQRRKLGS